MKRISQGTRRPRITVVALYDPSTKVEAVEGKVGGVGASEVTVKTEDGVDGAEGVGAGDKGGEVTGVEVGDGIVTTGAGDNDDESLPE